MYVLVNQQLAVGRSVRVHDIAIESFSLSKFGYIVYPDLKEFQKIVNDNTGLLCDPFALQRDILHNITFVTLPF
jgi:hypothetical protein